MRGLLGTDVPEAVAGRIVGAAEGNPLFVEELVGVLLDDGHLRRTDGGVEVVGAIDRVELPPTIQALLTARLDRLSTAERGVVERASIEGQVFHLGALAALGTAPDEILPTVRTLARKQLFRADQAALPGQDAYRFRHILIREAAYERVAKEVRARWHDVFADWLEALAGERVGEYEELLAHHLAEAARYRLEIGDSGEETRVLARRAATLLRHVADRTAAQGDFVAAARLLRRVAAFLPPADPARPIAIADCAGWLFNAGHMDAAAALSAAAGAAAEASGDRAAQLVCESLGRMIQIAASTDVDAGEEQAALDHARAGARGDRAGRPPRRGGPTLVPDGDLGGEHAASLRKGPRGGRPDARAGAAGGIAVAGNVRGGGRRDVPAARAGPDTRPPAGGRGEGVRDSGGPSAPTTLPTPRRCSPSAGRLTPRSRPSRT